MPNTEQTWVVRVLGTAIILLLAAGGYASMVEWEGVAPYVYGVIGGLSATVLGTLLVSLPAGIICRWYKSENLIWLGLTLFLAGWTWSIWWWYAWTIYDRPEWMRAQQVIPRTFQSIGLLMIWAGLVTRPSGGVLAKSWILVATAVGLSVTLAAVLAAIIR